MAVRILHCGKAITNYNICIEQKVAGFTKRVAEKEDLVYFAVNTGKSSLCGARARLGDITDYKPWDFCQPFDLKVLSEVGGNYWSLKYVQSSKTINDLDAISILEDNFHALPRDSLYYFDEGSIASSDSQNITFEENDILDDETKILGSVLR